MSQIHSQRAIGYDLSAEKAEELEASANPKTEPLLKSSLNIMTTFKKEYPSDEELLSLMPQSMRDDFAAASRHAAETLDIKPGIFRVCLNTEALEYAKAVLDHYSNIPIEPVPLSQRFPEPEDLHPTKGWAWFSNGSSDWRNLCLPTREPSDPLYWFPYEYWLPYWAIPYVPR